MSRNDEQHPELFQPAPARDYDPDQDGWKADARAELTHNVALPLIHSNGTSA
jgi:hypothetical protein